MHVLARQTVAKILSVKPKIMVPFADVEMDFMGIPSPDAEVSNFYFFFVNNSALNHSMAPCLIFSCHLVHYNIVIILILTYYNNIAYSMVEQISVKEKKRLKFHKNLNGVNNLGSVTKIL